MDQHPSDEELYDFVFQTPRKEKLSDIRDHLKNCEMCRIRARENQEILEQIKSMPLPECSEERWFHMIRKAARLEQTSPSAPNKKTAKPYRISPFRTVAWAAVSALIFFFGYLLGASGNQNAPMKISPVSERKIEATPNALQKASTHDETIRDTCFVPSDIHFEDSPTISTIRVDIVSKNDISGNDEPTGATINRSVIPLI